MPRYLTAKGPRTQDALVEEMKPEQKRAFALKLLKETDPDVLDAVHIAEQERANQEKVENSLKDEQQKQRNEQHYWIEINRQGPEDTETHVFIGAAGVDYWIQKDVAVPVPVSVLAVLDKAVVAGHVPIIDEGLGVKFLKAIRYKRRPYSRLGEATREDVDKFHAEQEQIRRESEDIVYGQEMARARLTQEAIRAQAEPFVPAYAQERQGKADEGD